MRAGSIRAGPPSCAPGPLDPVRFGDHESAGLRRREHAPHWLSLYSSRRAWVKFHTQSPCSTVPGVCGLEGIGPPPTPPAPVAPGGRTRLPAMRTTRGCRWRTAPRRRVPIRPPPCACSGRSGPEKRRNRSPCRPKGFISSGLVSRNPSVRRTTDFLSRQIGHAPYHPLQRCCGFQGSPIGQVDLVLLNQVQRQEAPQRRLADRFVRRAAAGPDRVRRPAHWSTAASSMRLSGVKSCKRTQPRAGSYDGDQVPGVNLLLHKFLQPRANPRHAFGRSKQVADE